LAAGGSRATWLATGKSQRSRAIVFRNENSLNKNRPYWKSGVLRMEKTDKPLTREALVSMEVIDGKGRSVGKVKDIAFSIGKMGMSLIVEDAKGDTQHIAWEDVQAAADYIILKPVAQQAQVAQAAQQSSSQPMCPTCGKPLTWIPQYQRWYCYNDKKYV
jgi:sporulation protein YlmC with PRC-barrel domain